MFRAVEDLLPPVALEVVVAPVARGECGIRPDRSGERSFVEGDPDDDPDILCLAGREEVIFGVLIEDVVDHLDDIDLSGSHGPESIGRLVVVDGNADMADLSLGLQRADASYHSATSVQSSSHTWSCWRSMVSTPRFFRLFSVDSIIWLYGKCLSQGGSCPGRPLHVLRGDLGGQVHRFPGVP